MGLIVITIYLVMLPAVIAFVLASVAPRLFPGVSFRKRTMIAAGAAGFVPMMLPAVVLLLADNSYGYSPLIPLFALLFVAAIVSLVVGLPAALLARRGKE